MPTLFRITGLFLLLSISVSAQNYTTFSLRAGVGTSATTFPSGVTALNGQQNNQGAVSTFSYMAGVGVNIPLTGRLSFQPELTYIRKGFELKLTQGGVSATGKYHFNNIEIPLLLKVAFAQGRFRGFVFAGPSVSYALNGNYTITAVSGANQITQAGKIKFGDGQSTGSLSYYSNSDYQQIDVGILGGIALGARVGTGIVLLEIRGGLGLTDFSRDEESKFRTGIVALSYSIPLGSVGNSQ